MVEQKRSLPRPCFHPVPPHILCHSSTDRGRLGIDASLHSSSSLTALGITVLQVCTMILPPAPFFWLNSSSLEFLQSLFQPWLGITLTPGTEMICPGAKLGCLQGYMSFGVGSEDICSIWRMVRINLFSSPAKIKAMAFSHLVETLRRGC